MGKCNLRPLAHIFGALVSLATLSNVSGQKPDVSFTRLPLQDCLESEDVRAKVITPDGSYWIGGTGGVCRFNGDQLELIDSNARVSCMFVDSRELVWVGSSNRGLYCFDSRTGTKLISLNDQSGANSSRISHSRVTQIIEDRDGELWVGTASGLNRIRIRLEQDRIPSCSVTVYRADPTDRVALKGNYISGLFADSQGVIWVAETKGHLSRFQAESNAFKNCWNAPSGIQAIAFGDDSHLWIGTKEHGAYVFDKKSHTAQTFSRGLSCLDVRAIKMTANGQLWVGTSGGLFHYNRDSHAFSSFQHDRSDPYSIPHSRIRSLTEDPGGNLWIATKGGLCHFDTRREWFDILQPSATPHSSKQVNFIEVINDGNVVIGSSSGIYLYRPQQSSIEKLPDFNHGSAASLQSPPVIYSDRDGTLWAANAQGELAALSKDSNKWTARSHQDQAPTALQRSQITSILEDQDGNFWIGTAQDGITLFDRTTGESQSYPPNSLVSSEISPGAIRCLFQDSHSRIWLGTEGTGLFRFDPNNKQYVSWRTPENGLGTERINAMLESSAGELWVATESEGILRFDPLSKKVVSRLNTRNSALPHDNILGIIADKIGNYWITTENGIATLPVSTPDKIRVFTEADGLQSAIFGRGALAISKGGTIYAGGPNGVTIIDPENPPHTPKCRNACIR